MEYKYDNEVMQADRLYQSEQTVQNELAMEKAKLKFWLQKQKENPSDKEIDSHVAYHSAEVERLEGEVKLA